MNRNKRIAIAACSVVAVAGVGCGTNHDQILSMLKNGDEITIEYAEQKDSTTKECIEQNWQTLSTYETNSTFRSTFEALTNNEDKDGTKRGTIYYTEAPTLRTTLTNKAFISYFENATKEELFDALKDTYIDVDENTTLESLQAASLNAYFNLFNSKVEGEYGSTQKVSRVDFLAALAKSTIAPTEQENITESEIASLVSSNSYIGENSTNNTETGKITKVEAAYVISNTLFKEELAGKSVSTDDVLANGLKSSGNIAKSNGYDKSGASVSNIRVAVLQKCLESNELDNELFKAMKVLEEKGIISAEYENNWNKAITKDESINLIYKALVKAGESSAVSSDIIAEELASTKSSALAKLETLTKVDKNTYVDKINSSESIDEIGSLVAEAESKEAEVIAEEQRVAAEEAAARKAAEAEQANSDTFDTERVLTGKVISSGGSTNNSGSSSSGNSGSGKTLGDLIHYEDKDKELEHYDGGGVTHLK